MVRENDAPVCPRMLRGLAIENRHHLAAEDLQVFNDFVAVRGTEVADYFGSSGGTVLHEALGDLGRFTFECLDVAIRVHRATTDTETHRQACNRGRDRLSRGFGGFAHRDKLVSEVSGADADGMPG